MAESEGAAAPRHSIFDRETIEGLHAASADASRAGDPAFRELCDQIGGAVSDSDAGRGDEAMAVLGTVVDRTDDLRLLFLAYQFFFRSSKHDVAERIIRRRLEIAPPESADAARAWVNLGLVHFFRSELEAAETTMRRALDIDRRIGNDFGVARDLGNLAMIPESRGELDAAESLYREGLAIAERIGAHKLIGTKLSNLGEIARSRGRNSEARELWLGAVAAFRAAGTDKYREQCEKWLSELEEAGPGGQRP